ncbi:MAG: iron chelate uptake ABC transporter family permease subunit, partial [Waterburya sp.]
MTITENKFYSGKTKKQLLLVFGLILGGFILGLSFIASMTWGAADISWEDIYRAFTAFDGSSNHLIIRTVRLPRSLVAMLVGAALAVAGAIMQGLTRNPLASPDILGVNTGAALSVVLGTFLLNDVSLNIYTWFAF